MTFNLGLGDIVAILTICSVLGSLGVNYVLSKARAEFLGKTALSGLTTKVQQMDNHLAQTIRHSDLGEVFTRIAQVERGVAVASEAINGVRDGMNMMRDSQARIEGQLSRMVSAMVERERMPPIPHTAPSTTPNPRRRQGDPA